MFIESNNDVKNKKHQILLNVYNFKLKFITIHFIILIKK